MSKVVDINRVRMDVAIRKWQSEGILEYDHKNEVLTEMICNYFKVYKDIVLKVKHD